MFKKNSNSGPTTPPPVVQAVERITSVLGPGVIWEGKVGGTGGVRIEGAFEGESALRGLLVVGETGRVTCAQLRANVVIVAVAVNGLPRGSTTEIQVVVELKAGAIPEP